MLPLASWFRPGSALSGFEWYLRWPALRRLVLGRGLRPAVAGLGAWRASRIDPAATLGAPESGPLGWRSRLQGCERGLEPLDLPLDVPKNIMPAICNFDTIRKHHLKTALHSRARVGVAESNPFLVDLMSIARLARVNFCVQCLNDSFGQVYDILAGDVFEVFQAGIRLQSQALGVAVSEKTDATIVSAFPYDEGVQIMKSFMPSAMVTRLGGSIFVVTELVEPLPGFFLDSIRRIKGNDACIIDPAAAEKLSRCEPLIEGVGVDFNMALLLVLAVAKKFNLDATAARACAIVATEAAPPPGMRVVKARSRMPRQRIRPISSLGSSEKVIRPSISAGATPASSQAAFTASAVSCSSLRPESFENSVWPIPAIAAGRTPEHGIAC